MLEITRDITAQVIAEEALRRNERLAAMGKLAGIVAHEINNPLEAITNAFYLLRQHPSLDEEAKYYAQIAEQELARVSHITKQTLSFYRESQKAVSVSLSELLDDVLELQHRPLQIANIMLVARLLKPGNSARLPVRVEAGVHEPCEQRNPGDAGGRANEGPADGNARLARAACRGKSFHLRYGRRHFA